MDRANEGGRLQLSEEALPPNDVSVFDHQTKMIAELHQLPCSAKTQSLGRLQRLRKEIEGQNRQLAQRVKLINKEEQVVLDKIMAGMMHEQKLTRFKSQDERLTQTFQTLKARVSQETEEKRKRISESRKKAAAARKERSERILGLKRENYAHAAEEKQRALSQRRLLEVKKPNFRVLTIKTSSKLRQEAEENLRALQERRAQQTLEQQAKDEVARIEAAKHLNKALLRRQLAAYDALMKERNFHKQFFSQIYVRQNR